MARRYAYLIAELLPRRMQVTADELCYLASMLEEWTLGDPSDVMVLALRLQQQADRRMHVSGLDISTLAYRMKALKPAEVLALLDAAERVHAAADPQSARQVADDIVTSMGRSA
ncbi:MAG: hypothetical protein ACREPQ_14445 [Rhodanobacter sp.]